MKSERAILTRKEKLEALSVARGAIQLVLALYPEVIRVDKKPPAPAGPPKLLAMKAKTA